MRFDSITLPTPFDIGPVNVYLIKSSPLTLIDAGPKLDRAFEKLESSLRESGLRVEDIERIIVTHAHPDHYGAAQTLADRSGARVYMHPKECDKMRDGWSNFDEGRVAVMVQAGAPEDAVSSFIKGSHWGRSFLTRIEDAEPVDEGYEFRFEDFALKVIHLPGHSSGHIGLYEKDSRVLFSGDHLLEGISPNPTIEPSTEEKDGRTRSLQSYLRSLDRLRGFDVAVAMSSHGEPVHDVPGKVEELFRHHEARADLIYRHLGEEGQTAYALANKLFPRLAGYEVYLGVSEVIAHLDLLMGQGRVAQSWEDGVYLYYRAAGITSPSAR